MRSLLRSAILPILLVSVVQEAPAERVTAPPMSPPARDLTGGMPMRPSAAALVPSGTPVPDAKTDVQAGQGREEPAAPGTAEPSEPPPLGLCDGS